MFNYPNRVPAALSDFTVVNNRLYFPSAIGTPVGVANEQLTTVTDITEGTIPESADLVIARTGSPTLTLPAASSRPFKPLIIKSISTGTVTVQGADGATIDGELTADLLQYDSIVLLPDGSNWLIL